MRRIAALVPAFALGAAVLGAPVEARAAAGVPQLSDEELRVLEWRYEQLRSLDFERRAARELAESKVELELLRRLVAQGCPPDLALRIAL